MQATFLVVLIFMVKFTLAQPVIKVEAKEVNDVDFSQYKSFGFTDKISRMPVTYFNKMMLTNQIREAVTEELMGLGYTHDSNNADLIVHFRVFQNPTVIRSMDDATSNSSSGEHSLHPDIASHYVKAGTLWIILSDAESSEAVWQGFVSGIIDNGDLFHDKVRIREAVNLVIERYNHRANDYTNVIG